MTPLQKSIDDTYGTGQLARRLLKSLRAAGFNENRLSLEDLMIFDELHVMGRDATLALGRLARLSAGMKVLDIGSGLGGPARTLASQFGCHVTGVDLSAEFVETANELSRRVGLANSVAFEHADALALPFADNGFDAVFMIHVNMNIEDKSTLFREALRVLKPGFRLLLWEICSGTSGPIVYPVPWADTEAFSYVVSIAELEELLHDAGIERLQCDDATADAIAWVEKRLAAMRFPRRARPGPDLNLIIRNFRERRTNISKNLLNKRIRVLRAMGVKTGA